MFAHGSHEHKKTCETKHEKPEKTDSVVKKKQSCQLAMPIVKYNNRIEIEVC